MRNVHERVISAPAAQVGALLDRLGSDRDRLWPAPAWPPMRLDRPLGVGADGGHGDVRYVVSSYEPGHRVEFRFHPEIGLVGYHALEVEPLTQESCVVRHVLDGYARGKQRLLWPVAVRWLHDAVLEDLLDNAEQAVTGIVARPYRYSTWVRMLRWLSAPRARTAPAPGEETMLAAQLETVDYADAYSVAAPVGVSADPREWADALFAGVPRFAAPGPRLTETRREVWLGENTRHLGYRAGLTVDGDSQRVTATLATVVCLHTAAGRAYFAVVRQFHPMFVRFLLRWAARRMVATAPSAATELSVVG